MRALITGAGGLLGHALARHLAERGEQVWGAFRHPPRQWPFGQVVALELVGAPGTEATVAQALAVAKPDVLFHLAALTNVDACETQPYAAWGVNVTGTGYVASAARSCGAQLVVMSTDYVFDGRTGGYTEDELPAPINWYGRSKARGEEAAVAAHPDALIVRGTLYGFHPDGRGVLGRLLATLRSGAHVIMRPDAYFTPLPTHLLAQRMTELTGEGVTGIRHLPGPRCSRWEFAQAVAVRFGLDAALVRAGAPVESGARAPRPLDPSLATLYPGRWPVDDLSDHLGMLSEGESWPRNYCARHPSQK